VKTPLGRTPSALSVATALAAVPWVVCQPKTHGGNCAALTANAPQSPAGTGTRCESLSLGIRSGVPSAPLLDPAQRVQLSL